MGDLVTGATSHAVAVEPVAGRSGRRRFIDVPFRLFRHDAARHPRLRRVEHLRLSPRHPAASHQEVRLWVASCGGQPVGRVAACVDRGLDEQFVPQGWVGFFECVDDLDVARGLFDAACGWARDRGADKVLGPGSFTYYDECGLLVSGFGEPVAVGTPWNPPYYEALWLRAGWEPLVDLLGFRVDRSNRMTDRQLRAADMARSRLGVRVRVMTPAEYVTLVKWFFEPERAPWGISWADVPLTDEETTFLARQITRVIHEDFSLVAEAGQDGELVGIVVTLADVNEAIRRVPNGRMMPFGWWHMATASRRLRGVRMLSTGVMPRWDGKGVAPLLVQELQDRAFQVPHVEYADLSWVSADNFRAVSALRDAGVQEHKRWRMYAWP